jgi:hypothetical protein
MVKGMEVDQTFSSWTRDWLDWNVVTASMTKRMVPISIGFAASPTRRETAVDEHGTVLIDFLPWVVDKAMDSIVAMYTKEMIVSEDDVHMNESDRFVADFHCHHPLPMALDKRYRATRADSSFDGNVDNRWRVEDTKRLRDR